MQCLFRRSARRILYNSYTRPVEIENVRPRCVADSFPILYSKCSLLGINPLFYRSYQSGKGKIFLLQVKITEFLQHGFLNLSPLILMLVQPLPSIFLKSITSFGSILLFAL